MSIIAPPKMCKHGLLPEECLRCMVLRCMAPPPQPARRWHSASEVLFSAAAEFGRPFTLAELAVAAWKRAPWLFALDGFPQHPDTAKTRCVVYGAKGLVRRGVLRRVGKKFEAIGVES